jgi:TonB family protein
MGTSITTVYLIATAIVVGAGVLLYVLRHLNVSYRYLFWTVVAHVVFVAALSVAVFSEPFEPSRLRAETIQVVMLPPLPESDEEEEPIVAPRPNPTEVKPEEETGPKPSPELPEVSRTTSVASRFIGSPLSTPSLPSQRRSSQQNLSPLSPSASGLPSNRSDIGLLSGVTLNADPSSVPRFADEGPRTLPRTAPSERFQRGSPSSSGIGRLDPRGSTSDASGSVALPKGFSLSGDVKGRVLKFVPDPPTASGTSGGEVVIRFWVAPDGHVERVQFVRKAGDPNLERVAQRWVERIQFGSLPANVEQVTQWGEVTVAFRKDFK